MEEADQVMQAVLGSSLVEALVLQAANAGRVALLWADGAYQMVELEEAVLGSSLVEALVLQAAMTALGPHTARGILDSLA